MSHLACAGLLAALLVAVVEAQSVETESAERRTSPVLTEAEFLSVLDDNHPAVTVQHQAVVKARARVRAAATLQNPALGVVREGPTGSVEQTDWTLSWQIPDASRGPEKGAREEAVEAAEARLSQGLLSLRLTMKRIYAEWAVSAARRERLSTQASRVEALAAREARRAARGETSGLEAHRLAIAAGGLRARVALAEASAQGVRASARRWHPDLPANAEPVLPAIPAPPELEGDHPLLRAARADLSAATLERKAAGRVVRSPELLAGWQRQAIGPESFDGPILGLLWSLPLFARNQAERAMADADVSAARAQLGIVQLDVGSSRAAALVTYRGLTAAHAQIEAAVVGNHRMLTGADAAFRHGELSLTDLLEIFRAAFESETMMLDLHDAALAAHRELERLADPGDALDDSLNLTPEP